MLHLKIELELNYRPVKSWLPACISKTITIHVLVGWLEI